MDHRQDALDWLLHRAPPIDDVAYEAFMAEAVAPRRKRAVAPRRKRAVAPPRKRARRA